MSGLVNFCLYHKSHNLEANVGRMQRAVTTCETTSRRQARKCEDCIDLPLMFLMHRHLRFNSRALSAANWNMRKQSSNALQRHEVWGIKTYKSCSSRKTNELHTDYENVLKTSPQPWQAYFHPKQIGFVWNLVFARKAAKLLYFVEHSVPLPISSKCILPKK